MQVLDERLTSSARLAATTGDICWEIRYRTAERDLDEAFNHYYTCLDKILGADAQLARSYVRSTDEYNSALVALEDRCFEFIRAGDREAAMATVLSTEYDHFKSLYSEAAEAADAKITDLLLAARMRNVHRANAIAWIAIGSAFAMFCVVIAALLRARAREIATTRVITECLIANEASARNALAVLNSWKRAIDQHAIIDDSDLDGTMIEVNDPLCAISGYTREEMLGSDHRIFNSGRHTKAFWAGMWQTILEGKVWRAEVRNKAKDGSHYWVDTTISPIRNAVGDVTGFITLGIDITEKKRAEEKLRNEAYHDKLTGLPNRAAFKNRLERAVKQLQNDASVRLAVLFLDFDKFKEINDTLGHDTGDEVLRQIATRLKEELRLNSDDPPVHFFCARLGGDEFVVLLEAVADEEAVSLVAHRLRDTFSRPYNIDKNELFSTASIGAALCDPKPTDVEDVLRNADIAMYEAKIAGKNRCVMFQPQMGERIRRRRQIEKDLRRAIDGREFFLMYQPIVEMNTGDMASMEALIRWKTPQGNIVRPDEFIPIAEQTGLIIPIGDWVLRGACRQFAEWRRVRGNRAPRYVAVNLSRNQLALPNLPAIVTDIIREYDIPAECLKLEITESAVMEDVVAGKKMLDDIKALGVLQCLDDFGTGYSSLSCLHEFPIDILKIDKSFVKNIANSRDFIALVNATVQLARNLGIRVVAEGIETAEQAAILQSMDCDFGQGFLFSKPLMPDDAVAFSAKRIAVELGTSEEWRHS